MPVLEWLISVSLKPPPKTADERSLAFDPPQGPPLDLAVRMLHGDFASGIGSEPTEFRCEIYMLSVRPQGRHSRGL
jgi:hypothetical protein